MEKKFYIRWPIRRYYDRVNDFSCPDFCVFLVLTQALGLSERAHSLSVLCAGARRQRRRAPAVSMIRGEEVRNGKPEAYRNNERQSRKVNWPPSTLFALLRFRRPQ